MGAALKLTQMEELEEPKLKDGDGGDGFELIPKEIKIRNGVNGWQMDVSYFDDAGQEIIEEHFAFVDGAEPEEKAGFTAALKCLVKAMGKDPAKVTYERG